MTDRVTQQSNAEEEKRRRGLRRQIERAESEGMVLERAKVSETGTGESVPLDDRLDPPRSSAKGTTMTTIATTFPSRPQVEAAIHDLHTFGIPTERMSVLMTENAQGQHFRIKEGHKGAEGAIGGGLAGGAVGAVLAGLVSVGLLAAPGLGLVAAGPILAALAGAGAGAPTGGLIGGLIGMGVPEHEARVLGEQVARGGILFTVQPDSPMQEHDIRRILSRHTGAKISKVGS
jgi:hypothetical protein